MLWRQSSSEAFRVNLDRLCNGVTVMLDFSLSCSRKVKLSWASASHLLGDNQRSDEPLALTDIFSLSQTEIRIWSGQPAVFWNVEIIHQKVSWEQVTGARSEARHILTIFSRKWTILLSFLHSLLSMLWSYFPPQEWAMASQSTPVDYCQLPSLISVPS